MTRILGIESSCDETSAAVVEEVDALVTLRSLVILSQDGHAVFGGVVPEIAARAHLTTMVPVVCRALEQSGTTVDALDAIAVTYTPGLVGALLVGVCYAKALAFALDRPVVPVHHLEGHLFATALEHADAVPPFTALLVSGGHTLLLDVPAWGSYRLLGATRDDAAGEAFDKVAKLLGLPYPGGRHIETLAVSGDPERHRFTRPMLRGNQRPGDADYFDFSFSGIKTAVLSAVTGTGAARPRDRPTDARALDTAPPDARAPIADARGAPDTSGARDGPEAPDPARWRADIARGFQDAVIETLVEKTARAVRAYDRARIVLGGGVACNRALVDAMRRRASSLGAVVYAPSARLATDNAAMIARAGLFRFGRGEIAPLDLNAYASRPLPGISY